MATDWNQFIKNNFVKIVVIILLVLITSIVLFGLFTKKHINLFGLEINGKSETEYKERIVHVHDTIVTYKNDIKAKNVNAGTNYGTQHIGDENYNGIKQRHVTSAIIEEILKALPNNYKEIDVVPYADKESILYADEIRKTLTNKGMKVHERGSSWFGDNYFDSLKYEIIDSNLMVWVRPASNVKQ
jgi:hypothetical protein